MTSTTIFKNFTNPIENKSLLSIANEIKSDKHKSDVEIIRLLISQGKKDEANNKKKQLSAFTPSAVFTEKRQVPFLEIYNRFLHLDYDKLTPEQLQYASKITNNIPFTFLSFISPSGNGLKVFVEVNTGLDFHDIAYLQVKKFYDDAIGLNADPSCKDVTRLCFMSYDPNAYINIKNKKFIIEQPIENLNSEELNNGFLFNQQVEFTNQKAIYEEGNRNNYIYNLASNCNRIGLSQMETETFSLNRFDLPKKEIQDAVNSAYSKHKNEFGKFAKVANYAKLQSDTHLNTTQTDDEIDEFQDFLKSTPTIPNEVFEHLPKIFKEGALVFNDARRRDVFITGAIGIISGCLPNVSGIYDNERVYPNLYTFIIAPPASGKGVLKNAKRLADKYHQRVLEQSRSDEAKYEAEMVNFKNITRNLKKGENQPEQPSKPAFKIVYIPADCSSSRMIEHLQLNGGHGIICETEADTMSGAKKQDWGDYSPVLRSAFHNEKITFSRKSNNEYIEIIEPRLSVALSGTPAQAPRLISSSEDGLFSRFIFYAFKNEILWKDPSPNNNNVVYNDHFENLSNQVLELVEFLEESPTNIHLTQKQWQLLNNKFTQTLNDVTTFTSEEASGTVFRLGIILYRICMIFTALRKFENADLSNDYTCIDEDFDIALKILETYLSHSILMFNNLPNNNDELCFKGSDSKRKFFDSLPDEFERKHAIELGLKLKFSERTIDNILKMAIGHKLSKPKSGLYKKTQA